MSQRERDGRDNPPIFLLIFVPVYRESIDHIKDLPGQTTLVGNTIDDVLYISGSHGGQELHMAGCIAFYLAVHRQETFV